MSKFNSSWIERNTYYREEEGELYGKKVSRFESYERPLIVTLCGSTRFKEAFERAQADLTDKGIIVISVGRFGHRDGMDMDGDHKKMLDELHKRKIDLSDGVYIVSVGGYIGTSTRSEIDYAIAHGKTVEWMDRKAEENYHAVAEGQKLGSASKG